jgi:rhamnosyltransferase
LWPDGRQRLIRKSQKQRSLDFLFESAGPGCTYVMTAECAAGFKQFLARNRSSVAAVQFHDWMLYAWVRAQGFTWYIVPRATMLYRQHGKNEYGANSGWAAFRRRLAQVRSGWYREQILQISRLIGDGASFTAEGAAVTHLVQARGILSRIALAAKVHKLRRELKDRAWLFLACMLGGI